MGRSPGCPRLPLLWMALLPLLASCQSIPEHASLPPTSSLLAVDVVYPVPLGRDPSLVQVFLARRPIRGGTEELPELVPASFVKNSRAYLLDPEPGTYSLVAVTSAVSPPLGDDPVAKGVAKATLPGTPANAIILPAELIQRTRTAVAPGEVAFMGALRVRRGEPINANAVFQDELQKQIAERIHPGSTSRSGLAGWFTSTWMVDVEATSFSKGAGDRESFFDAALSDLEGSPWAQVIARAASRKTAAAPPSPPAPRPASAAAIPAVVAAGAQPAPPAPNAATAEPEASIPEPEASTPEPEIATTASGVAVPEPEVAAPEPVVAAAESEVAIPKPDTAALEAEAPIPEPETAAPERAIAAPEPDTAALESEAAIAEPNAEFAEPESAIPEPGAPPAEPEASTPEAHVAAAQPAASLPSPERRRFPGVPPNSRLAEIEYGMSFGEVREILGDPDDRVDHLTAKAWIPFYTGRGARLRDWIYNGEGRVVFSLHEGTLEVLDVVYDPDEGK